MLENEIYYFLITKTEKKVFLVPEARLGWNADVSLQI